ncbi:hypothetical protein DAPPUDRAFT_105891 [Daphnia pulex]|uniref:Uncharacterized protein n=1 Tax=Daphnia pulex TaxID=6669 RepID=E9GS57_DAPPU|nr:hypothetical protein DAPPUDRAFT_105891 [Daphnia pulex]|eukprot:EFX77728.1 hypothetical protein DAPPUDRAFT_105891 [Daphnia pulex]
MLPHPTTPRLQLSITLFSATYCTDFPKYYSVPSCYTGALADNYSEAAKHYSAPIYTTTTEAAKYCAVLTCYTKAALSCYVEQKYYTDAPVHYTTTYATPQPPSTTPKKPPVTRKHIYGVVLLLGVVSLMVGSTAGVAMSPWYGGNQTATPPPPPSYTTYATTSSCTEVFKYNTTKGPEFYTTTYSAPIYYTDALKYYSAPSYYTTKATEHDYASYYTETPICYTEFPADVSTKTVEYYTEAAKYFSAPIYTTTTEAVKYYAFLTCYTKAALSCYFEQKYYTDAPVYYTTTYATPSYNTVAPKYYTEEVAYYTTTYAA